MEHGDLFEDIILGSNDAAVFAVSIVSLLKAIQIRKVTTCYNLMFLSLAPDKMSEQRKRKYYAAFLIDRPLNAGPLQQGKQEALVSLMNCLRHRLLLTADSKRPEPQSQNVESCGDGGVSIESLLAKYQHSSAAAVKKTSLYDTLLQLIDTFDATGAAEIFRLLLERRTAIPLFVPDSRKHHLNLFRHITIPGVNTRLGEDQSLFRIAVISCRQRNVSQTTEIMKSVFNVQSVHRQDLSTGSLSSNPLIAEIGVGCLVIEAYQQNCQESSTRLGPPRHWGL
ncbi:hypothetical protein DAPPUDRAFT_264902 [Daphnia pulex]|uniref:Uncharacterized protein n=1 Tax=Daphnia pulex TaxID=6669 RepID=E9HSJ1_DAPPU|nr:hypothetical protein DAPPUDRAFT_264902 [Daphnia pulex]|eukprot:EFX65298.1 hypothetical protein DAPPUDRAFT_264902 [Daphnia pulex]